MSESDSNDFILYMFKEDYDMMSEWNSLHSSNGALFGLWTNSGNPVLHIIYDVNNTEKEYPLVVSKHLHDNDGKRMLCRIGVWSFNPKLFERNDYEEVMKDLPNHAKFVFLDWKKPDGTGSLKPSLKLYTKIDQRYKEGSIECLKGQNPFRISGQEFMTKKEHIECVPGFFNSIGFKCQEEETSESLPASSKYHSSGKQKYRPGLHTAICPDTKEDLPFTKYMGEDATTCTNKNQWYLTEYGRKKLYQISETLKERVEDTNVKISRDEHTHNVMLQFSFNEQSCTLVFPQTFHSLPAQLYRRKVHHETHGRPSVEVVEEAVRYVNSINEFVEQILNASIK